MAHNRVVDQALSVMVEAAGREETAEMAEITILYCLAKLRDLRDYARARPGPAPVARGRRWYLASEGRPTIVE